MNTLKIIEGIDKSFHSHKFERLQLGEGKYIESAEVLNWHKQSIIQIISAEIERKRGMKKHIKRAVDELGRLVAPTEAFEIRGDKGYNQALEEDIAHLQNLLDSLK